MLGIVLSSLHGFSPLIKVFFKKLRYGHCFSIHCIIEETSGKEKIVKVVESQFQPRSSCC